MSRRIACVACVMFFSSILNAPAQERAPSKIDSVITGRDVAGFADFELSAHEAAAIAGLPQDVVSAILKEFKDANSVRVILPQEWRPLLLELLYKDGIPYDVARHFMGNLDGRALDTGFLSEVRSTDLTDRQVYKAGRGTGEPTAPKPLFQPLPAYTQQARAYRVQGMILLTCIILEDGSVTNCRVDRPLGYGLDESALLTIQNRWKFSPATLGGQNVPVDAKIEVTMRLY